MNEQEREETIEALRVIWRTSGLFYPGGISLHSEEQLKRRMRMFRELSEELLGDDWPGFEQLC